VQARLATARDLSAPEARTLETPPTPPISGRIPQKADAVRSRPGRGPTGFSKALFGSGIGEKGAANGDLKCWMSPLWTELEGGGDFFNSWLEADPGARDKQIPVVISVDTAPVRPTTGL
jgi:hypothetical protein